MAIKFLPIEQIEIGSHWLRAGNPGSGYRVIGKNLKYKYIRVEEFIERYGEITYTGMKRKIDWHKLQYRYYLKE